MVSPGKVEIGQGIVTALAQIAADELDVDIGRVRMVRATTAGSPERRRHLGQPFGAAVRPRDPACLRRSAADLSELPRRTASASASTRSPSTMATISGPGNVRTSYWELAGEVSLDREATPGAVTEISGAAHAGRTFGAAARYSRQGVRAAAFHSRFAVARHAAWPGAAAGNARGRSSSTCRRGRARGVAGLVAIVRDGNFAGVVSETEDGAEAALKALRKGAAWSAGETLPDENRLAEWLKSQPAESTVIDKKTAPARGCEKPHDPAAI